MHYTIVASKYIRAHSKYSVAINLHEHSEPCNVKVGVRGTNKNYEKIENVTIEPFTTKLIDINTDELLPGNESYKLFIEGFSMGNERKEYYLDVQTKYFSGFIQTDKAMYKPGDCIKFRVLVLDYNLRPAILKKPMKIIIMDAQQNRIKQWLNVETESGVYFNELQLSNYPVLGNWRIIVEVMNEKIQKTFDVAEYVLPKFDITINTPTNVTYKDGKIHATIQSNYTYGKPVKGDCTVSVTSNTLGDFSCLKPFGTTAIPAFPMNASNNHIKHLQLDGSAVVEFDMYKDLNITEQLYTAREFKMEATITEDLTGQQKSTSAIIKIHKSKYKIKTNTSAPYFKPGLPFGLSVQVTYHDGSPIPEDSSNAITIRHGFDWNENEYIQNVYKLDSNGMVPLTFLIPENSTNLRIVSEYLDVKQEIGCFHKNTSNVNVYLQAVLKTNKPTINKEVTVQIQCTENMQYFTYQLIGRGNVLISETIKVNNKMCHEFKFLATFEMVPKAKLIVYYIKDNDIISDKLDIQFEEDLHNFIDLKSSTMKAGPGQDIDLTITTNPNSFVGLLGADQSVLLLKSGNDLSKDDVFQQLNEYNQEFYCDDIWQDFYKAGAVLLTNAKLPERIEFAQCCDEMVLDNMVLNDFDPVPLACAVPMAAFARPTFKKIIKPIVPPTIRKLFPETWIWDNINSADGKIMLNKKIPDTITSWIITGFSINPTTGLGLTKLPTKLQVFQPFFVSLNLPYSIKRGETVAISVTVFNYMEEDVCGEITLYNNDNEFEFTENSSEYSESPKNELLRKKLLKITSNAGATISFMIKPTKVGPIKIKVTATTPLAGDGMEKILPVEPEGKPHFFTKSTFIDLRETNAKEDKFLIDIPANAVPDSTRITISVVGDILGTTIKNLDNLIQMPCGCGEQTMIILVPNIVVLEYLKNTQQLTDSIETKAKKFMESGYQRELTYKHDDGSFSAFGKSDKSGSTWLTAFVARAFRQASVHIDVEERIIAEALQWLSQVQLQNGSFPEVGNICHKDMQGQAGSGIALTAYTLISFLENKNKITIYDVTINKATQYIIDNMDGLNDIYSLSLVLYALQLAEHNLKDAMFERFHSKATVDGGKKWWNKIIPKSNENHWYCSQPNSVNVEISAYGLLAFMTADKFTDALPIMKWLIEQRNEQGGFQSTQDTIVGLHALAKFAEKISSNNTNLEVAIKYDENVKAKINVDANNSIILQSHEIPSSVRTIDVNSSGNGFSLLQLSYQYNLNDNGESPRFTIKPELVPEPNSNLLILVIQTSFIPIGDDIQSNMAVMEVSLPSGFTADLDKIMELENMESIKKVETKNGDTIIVIYFDNLNQTIVKPKIDAIRSHRVENLKPAPVTIYDYYDNSRRALEFYHYQEPVLIGI